MPYNDFIHNKPMTYDELYEHIVHYVALPHTTITVSDKRKACLILGAFVEFILDCADNDIDPRTLHLTDYAEGKVNDLVAELDAELEEIKMSGGHFGDYCYFQVSQFARDLEEEIERNGKPRNENRTYGEEYYPEYSPEVIEYFGRTSPLHSQNC